MVYRISGICFVVAMIFLMVNPVDARWLIINTLPENASVLVDAVSAGLTPVRLEGNDGERMVVTVSLEPFADFVFEYVFEANRVMFIDLEQRVEVDEDTYWQRKTNANTLQIAHEPAKEPVMEPTHEPAEEPVEEPAGAQGGVNPDVRLVKPVLQEVTDPDPLPADLIGKQDKGISIFAVQIRRDGSVIDMKPMTEMPDDAIRLYLQRWVKTWKFNPATANGVSVEGVAQAKILFDLEKGSFAVPVLGVEKRVSMAGEVDTASDPEPEPLGEATAEETPVDEGMLGEATAEETPVDEGMLGEATAEETPVDEGMLGEATAEETPVRDSPVDQPPAGEDGTTGETEYYTIQEVDAPARIFTPPSPGNIPLEIINLNLQGEAVFAVFIMPTGEVGRVDVITGTGNTKLDDYVIPMIRKSFWEPAQKDGKAVGFTRNLTLDFFTTACKFDFTDLDQ